MANSPASPCARTTAYRRAADNFELFVGAAFGALMASLKSLRGAGIVEHDVLLVVLSTDPGPRLEELALRCVDELNSESVEYVAKGDGILSPSSTRAREGL